VGRSVAPSTSTRQREGARVRPPVVRDAAGRAGVVPVQDAGEDAGRPARIEAARRREEGGDNGRA
jgi:hypothetical protein